MKRTDGTAHGFRSSFRVWSAECTPYSQEECEAAYRCTDLFELRRRLMKDWAAYFSGNCQLEGPLQR